MGRLLAQVRLQGLPDLTSVPALVTSAEVSGGPDEDDPTIEARVATKSRRRTTQRDVEDSAYYAHGRSTV